MTTQIENIGQLERRMTMAVPLAEVEKQVGDRLKQLARNAKMPGFRPGKVPMKLVAQQYGPQVRGEVIGDAVERAFTSAIQGNNLRVAGQPKIEPAQARAGEQLEFNATFEVYPEIQLGDVSGAPIERPTLTVGEAEVDKTLESLRKQRVVYSAVARPAQPGDRVTVDFLGKVDGVEFPGGKGEGFKFVLGERRMLPEFESNVLGMDVGQQKTFELKFPDDYHGKEVAGKTASFEATVKQVEEPKLPEVNAEFAQALGVADGDLAKMRSDIRDNVEREAQQRLAGAVKQRVMQLLSESTQVDVPKALVESEIQRMVGIARADLQSRGVKNVENFPIDPEMFREQATRRVTLGLILSELIKQHQLGAKPEQVRKLVEEYARTYEQPFEVIKWVYSQPKRLAEFEGAAVEDNVVAWVLSRAKVEDKAVSFDDLMSNPAQ